MYDGHGYYRPSFEDQALTAGYVGAVILASPLIACWLLCNRGKEIVNRYTTPTWLHEIKKGNPSPYHSPYPPRSKV